jgi:hypothetical protein
MNLIAVLGFLHFQIEILNKNGNQEKRREIEE